MSKRRGVKSKPVPAASKAKSTSQFLEALKLYESKNYKKSLKVLETVLKKDRGSVDALALKGLVLFSTNEKEEATSYVKNAIDKIKTTGASAICCHVLGIYMRSTKQYADSINWFQKSLDNGSTNKQIYRDLATLQSQVGDFKSVLSSRKTYWESFMGYRANWTALAVAQDINNENQQAIGTLSQFQKLADGKLGESEMYENNECLIYKNDIMYRAAGSNKEKLENVLKNLNDIESNVYDKYAVLERRASVFMKLGRFTEASKVYRALIKRNPDNFQYYKLLEVSLQITGNNQLRKALYEKFEKFYPRAEPPKFISLTFIKNEDELKSKMEKYVLAQLNRGVPATFSNIKTLYTHRGNIVPKICEEIAMKFYKTLSFEKSPEPYIWTCYFLGQHYLFMKQFQQAQEYIDKAIKNSPSNVEFYVLKGRILKHMGLLQEAAQVVNDGRNQDLQDRFINTKSTKYYLRANNIEKGVEVASLFTKNDEAVNGVKDLHFVEAAWFIIEQADAYHRLYLLAQKTLKELKQRLENVEPEKSDPDATNSNGDDKDEQHSLKKAEWEVTKNKGLAMKRYLAISKIYKQFDDDQLDFHSYCMRKGTPRAYLEMLDWGKTIFLKPIYMRAMKGYSKLSFEIYDERKREEKIVNEEEEAVVLKSKDKKSKKEAASLKKLKENERKSVLAYPVEQEKDVFGESLISTKSPIEDFKKYFFDSYELQAKEELNDYVLNFNTHYRTGKLALCLGALTKYSSLNGKNSSISGALSIILALATRDDTSFEIIAKKVAIKGLETEFPTLPVNEINNTSFDWLEYFKTNYNQEQLKSLLLLKSFEIGSDSEVKELIVKSLTKFDPLEQNKILQYVL